jgi:hypothetical protein
MDDNSAWNIFLVRANEKTLSPSNMNQTPSSQAYDTQ